MRGREFMREQGRDGERKYGFRGARFQKQKADRATGGVAMPMQSHGLWHTRDLAMAPVRSKRGRNNEEEAKAG